MSVPKITGLSLNVAVTGLSLNVAGHYPGDSKPPKNVR